MWFVPLESALANTWVDDQSDKQCTHQCGFQKKICTQLHSGIGQG